MARVLVVDDEDAIRSALQAVFEREAWEVETAESGEEALVRFAPGRFDLLLVDKNMPGGMSGLDLVRDVRASDALPAVVMMTAYASSATAAEAVNLDIDAYLEKPFEDIFAVVGLGKVFVDTRRKRMAPVENASAPLRVLLAALEGAARERLSGKIASDRYHLSAAATEGEVAEVVAVTGADVVIVDGGSFPDRLVPLVEGIAGLGPRTVVVVAYEGEPDLAQLQRLIERGVKGVFNRASYERSIGELLARLDARRRGG